MSNPKWVIDECGIPNRLYAVTRLPQNECVNIRFLTSRELKERFKARCREQGKRMAFTHQEGIVYLATHKGVTLAEEDIAEALEVLEGKTFYDSFYASPYIRKLLNSLLDGGRVSDKHRILNALMIRLLRLTEK